MLQPKKRPRLLSGGAFLFIFIAAALTAQDFQIRTRVDLVVVPFTVKGDGGKFIPGLDAEDFTVLEDGEEQTIQEFSIDPVPLSAALVIDTGLGEASLAAVQEAIPAMAAAFSEFDEVAVYRYDDRVSQALDFTMDPEALRAGLDQLRGIRPGPQVVGGGPVVPAPTINGVPVIPSAERPLRRDTRVLHDAIYESALAVSARPDDRRHVVIVISDGNDEGSEMEFEDNILFLLDTEIQVYAINVWTGFFGRIATPLDDYTKVTGGDLYQTRPGPELQPLFSRITEQARNQYVLTYVSTNQAPPNRIVFRNIDVVCEPYEVVHKQGYYQIP